MPSPISFSVPYGPWGFDPASGAPVQQYFPDATFFSFGPAPYTGTVANSVEGAISQPFVGLLGIDSPWADCQLSTAELTMAINNSYSLWNMI